MKRRWMSISTQSGTKPEEFYRTTPLTQDEMAAQSRPTWMQTDPYIQSGYREELRSVAACTRSLFYTHNELVNAWSHLLPAIAHSIVLVREARQILDWEPSGPSRMNALLVQLYAASVVICLWFSVRTPILY
jgi:adiponectin receptor